MLLNVRLVVCFFSISMVSWLVPAGMTMAAKVLPRWMRLSYMMF